MRNTGFSFGGPAKLEYRGLSARTFHVSAWQVVQAVKILDRPEETEKDGTIIQREREKFTNELSLVYATAKTAILHLL